MFMENGDRLTRPEFERRYTAMSHLKKAELVEGMVYMASPLRFESHAKPHALIMTWLGTYYAATPGVQFGDNATVRIDEENEFQPDAVLFLPHVGKARVTPDDYVEGTPELIVEIAASTVSYDFHIKRRIYQRHGVPEYLLWRVEDKQFDWFMWQAGEYVRWPPDSEGLIRSQGFPGLVLAVSALLAGDYAKVLTELHRGLQTAEHAALVERLARVGI